MTIKPRAITVCVEYDDLLAITLPHTLPHVREMLVVTSPYDTATVRLCDRFGVRVFQTEAFYENGAEFNKGAAMEQGFDVLGRRGWILVMDADIVLPKNLDLSRVFRNRMWGCPRVFWDNPSTWNGQPWDHLPLEKMGDVLGYFQLFHAGDVPGRPWYPTNYRSAATVDQWFGWKHFPYKGMYLCGQSVLHLGPPCGNWCGRTQPKLDGTIIPHAASRRAALDAMVKRRMAKDPNAETLP